MKSSRIVVLLVAVFALALVWRVSSRRAAAAPVAAPEAAARASAPAAPPAPAAVASPVAAGATLPALFGARGPVTLGEVPAGRFREQLLKLAPAAQTRALATLERLRIPHNDVEALATDVDGHLFYECAREPAGTPPPPAALPVASAAPVAVTMPPIRHSRPGASRVLYLDFNGHNVIDTAWNAANVSSGRPAVDIYACRPYDRDGDVTTFSDTEQAEIVAIWQRVAEDYSAFDVDVTTEEPAAFTAQTLRALVTHTIDANGVANPSSATASGVAYLDVFGRDNLASYSPAFVYYDVLSSAASVAEVVSHELGHNLALSHDGTLTKSYYPGHGTGELSWGPIMGAPFSRTVTQWSKGEYFNANNPQDDLAIIGARLTLRADVAGNSLATATPAPNTGNDVSGGGLVRAAGESYFHRVITAAGRIGFTAAPVTSGNADLRLELLDSNGAAVALDDPEATRLGGVFTANPVPAGVYYLKITAAGTGTPLIDPPTGYTSYGSIGQYTLTGTVVAAAPAIVSGTTASVGVGHPFHYQTIAAGDVSSYGAAGLPPGVTIDATTGILSGRPTATGVYSVTLSANNSIGTNTATLTLTVNNAAPAVTASSAPAVVLAPAESTTLSVTSFSVNGAVAYQWFRDGRPIADATGATHNVSAAERGLAAYWVTLTNTVGTTRSAPFFVRVAPAITRVHAWSASSSGSQPTVPAGLGRVVDVAAGSSHAIAVRADGSVVTWGAQSDVSALGANVVAVAASSGYSAALRADGTVAVIAAGATGSPAQSVPAGLRDVVALAAGYYHFVALKTDGTVVTWGTDNYGLLSVPVNLSNVVAIAAGGYRSMALKADGTPVAWGYDVGLMPVALTGVTAMAASDSRSIVLKSGGTTVAWGAAASPAPSLLPDGTSIVAGSDRFYAVLPDGTLMVWAAGPSAGTVPANLSGVVKIGAGSFGVWAVVDATGDAAPTISAAPVSVLRAVGDSCTFAVTASGPGVLSYQWRKNGVPIAAAAGSSFVLPAVQLTDAGAYDVVISNHAGVTTSAAATLSIEPPPSVTSAPPALLSMNEGAPLTLTVAATTANGPLSYQWKKGTTAIPGATTPTYTIPAFTPADAGVYVLEITDAHGLRARCLCFVRPAVARTQVVVWGQLGNGPAATLPLLSDAVRFHGNSGTGIVVRADGSAKVWGYMATKIDPLLAVRRDIVDAATGSGPLYTLHTDGRVRTWSSNGLAGTEPLTDVVALAGDNGTVVALLADGTVRIVSSTSSVSVPVGLTDVVAIAAGANHALALRRDGTVVAFGNNYSGQRDVPAGLSGVTAIAAATDHSVALKSDGKVVAWGRSYSYTPATVPVDLGPVTAIAAGTSYTLALGADGSLRLWGNPDAAFATIPSPSDGVWVLGDTAGNPYFIRAAASDTAPTITTPPAAIATASGVPQRFTVRAAGPGPLRYQWRKNGVAIPGATQNFYDLIDPQPADAASYDVVVTNHIGSVTSAAVALTLVTPPTITVPPPRRFLAMEGQRVRLAVTASSTYGGALAYQWKKNNRPIAGATTAAFELPAFTPAEAGAYTVEVADTRGVVSRATSFVVPDFDRTQLKSWNATGPFLPEQSELQMLRPNQFAIRRSGELVAWDYNGRLATGLPTDRQPYVDVAASYSENGCALSADGTVSGWSSSTNSAARNVPPNLRGVIALSRWSSDGIALCSDGRIYRWGYQGGLTALAADTGPVSAIATGNRFLLALRTDGTVLTTPLDSYGNTPVPPVGLSGVNAIAAGYEHCLALKSDGTVVAWGNNSARQCNVPEGLSGVIAIAAESDRSYALTADGTLRMWGAGYSSVAVVPAEYGKIVGFVPYSSGAWILRDANADAAPRISVQPVDSLCAAGSPHTFRVTATGPGTLTYQWRRDGVAIAGATQATLTLNAVQLTDAGRYDVVVSNYVGRTTSAPATLEVASAPLLTAIGGSRRLVEPGAAVTLAFTPETAAGPLTLQWKKNNRPLPGATTATLALPNFTDDDAGAYTLEATDARGLVSRATIFVRPSAAAAVRAWGSNAAGQTTLPAVDLSRALAVAASGDASFALCADGTVAAWGQMSAYENPRIRVPAGLSNVVALAAGINSALALRADGTVTAWSAAGALPVPATARNVIAVAAHAGLSAVLCADGSVVYWNSSNSAAATVLSPSASPYVAVAVGEEHVLALRADGTVAGIATTNYGNSAATVPTGLTNVVALAAGGRQSLALRADGSVVSWGENAVGQAIGAGDGLAITAGASTAGAVLADRRIGIWPTSASVAKSAPSDLVAVRQFALGATHGVALVAASGAAPTVTRAPISITRSLGDVAIFDVVATGAGPLSYQWRKNGVPITGANASSLVVSPLQDSDAAAYDVLVVNASGSVASTAATLTISAGPQVTSAPPARVAVAPGTPVTLAATATSAYGPITYRWKKDNRPLANATTATLALGNLTAAQAGAYTLEITDARGATTRVTSFVLPVRPQTQLRLFGDADYVSLKNPLPTALSDNLISAALNDSCIIVLRADGTVAQWEPNNSKQVITVSGLNDVVAVAISGGSKLALRADGTVWVWSNYASSTVQVTGLSDVIALVPPGGGTMLALRSTGTLAEWGNSGNSTAYSPSVMTSAFAAAGARLSDVVACSAGGDYSYTALAVRVDGSVVSWSAPSNSSSLVSGAAAVRDAVRVANTGYTGLAVRADGLIQTWGESAAKLDAALVGGVAVNAVLSPNLALALRADGSVGVWQNGSNVTASVPAGPMGAFGIAVGSSRAVILRETTNDTAPTITVPPASQVVAFGANATFTVTAGGPAPYFYQWRKDGVLLPGATQATLVVPAVTAVDVGSYDVIVSNHVGATTSAAATLRVGLAELFATQPATRQLVATGTPVTLTFALREPQPGDVVRWQFNNRPIPGATGLTYSIPSVTAETAGAYTLIVTRADNSVVRRTTFVQRRLGATRLAAWGKDDYGQSRPPVTIGDALAVAAGEMHGLALREDSTVIAWGYNGSGQCNVPANLRDVVAIAAGSSHSVALRADGTVVQWGSGTAVPANLRDVVAVAAEGARSAALKSDGAVVVWGGYGSTDAVPPTDLTAIALGSDHVLGIRQDGAVVAWALSSVYSGQTAVPAGLTNAVAISASSAQSAALRADGRLYVWGSGGAVAVGATAFTSLECGPNFGVARRAAGGVLVWGDNSFNQRTVPATLGDPLALAAGTGFVVALCEAAGDVAPTITEQPADVITAAGNRVVLRVAATGSGALGYQWRLEGNPIAGATQSTLTLSEIGSAQAGRYDVVVANHIGATTSRVALVSLATPPEFSVRPPARLVAALGQPLSLTAATTSAFGPVTYRWKKDNRPIPGANGPTLSLPEFTAADGGAYTVEATDARGLVARTTSFVLPDYGCTEIVQFGSEYSGTGIPADVQDAISVVTRGSYGAVLRRDGTVVLWGNSPVVTGKPENLTNVVALAAASDSILALRADGTVVGWGSSYYNVLNPPAAVRDVIAIAHGGNVAFALRSDGAVVGWGSNYSSSAPLLPVPTLPDDISGVATNGSAALAVTANGALVGWGERGYGQTRPPSELGAVVAAAVSYYHSLVLQSNGTLVAWGPNNSGVAPAPVGNFRKITTSDYRAAAIRNDGTLAVWGNSYGYGENTPPANTGDFFDVALSGSTTVALRRSVGDVLPVIVTAPQSTIAARGGDVSLSVVAGSARPLFYQWRRNGVNLAGATASTLTLKAVTDAAAGDYDVVVRNAAGAVTSTAATLRVEAPPLITTAPDARQLVALGASRTLAFTLASEHGPLAYRWKKNNRVLPEATSASLTLTNFAAADAGAYTLEVTDALGLLTRATTFVLPDYGVTQVRVWGYDSEILRQTPPTLTDALTLAVTSSHAGALRANGAVTVWGSSSAVANPPAGLTDAVAFTMRDLDALALRKDGTLVAWGSYGGPPAGLRDVIAIAVGDNARLALRSDGSVVSWGRYSSSEGQLPAGLTDVSAIAAGASGYLALKVDGTVVAWGTASAAMPAGLANVVAITANGSAFAALKSDGTFVRWGGAASSGDLPLLRAVTLGDSNYGIGQTLDGALVGFGTPGNNYGQTRIPVDLGMVLAFAAGNYHGIALRDVRADAGPMLTAEPTSVRLNPGARHTFNVAATGTGPLTYQWFKDGVAIAGATSTVLTLPDVSASDVGAYTVRVTNHLGARVSAAGMLRLLAAPEFTVRPARRVPAGLGASVSLSASAVGKSPESGTLRYQWKKNNRVIAGATGPVLTLPSFTLADAGAYTLEVTDALGAVARHTSFVSPAGLSTQVRAWGTSAIAPPATLNDALKAFSFASGSNSALALRSNGQLAYWGTGSTPFPVGLGHVVDLAVGAEGAAIALREDQTVVSPGAVVPANATEVISVAAGANHYLALRADGRVVAWSTSNSNYYGQATVPDGLQDVVAISAYGSSSAAVTASGTLVIWGYRAAATIPASFNGITDVAAGNYHVLGRKPDGTAVGLALDSSYYGEATPPADLGAVSRLVAGSYVSFALKADGTVRSWGSTSNGLHPVPADLGNVIQLAVASSSAVAVRLATNDVAPQIVTPPQAQNLAVGASLALSVTVSGTGPFSYQWRRDGVAIPGATASGFSIASAAPGDAGSYDVVVTNHRGSATSAAATVTLASPPSIVAPVARRTAVTLGQPVALTVSATADNGPLTYRWKKNNRPIAGATGATYSIPSAVLSDSGAYTVEVIDAAGRVRRSTGFVAVAPTATQLIAFGYSNPRNADTSLKNVSGPLLAVVDGSAHSVALKADGTAVAWGYDSYGQNVVPAGLTDVVAIAAANDYSLALKADGTVAYWGYPYGGPKDIPAGLAEVIAISAAPGYALALKSDGTVVMWGTTSTTFTVPAGLADVVSIFAAPEYALATKADGSVVVWGSPSSTQASAAPSQSGLRKALGSTYAALGLKQDGTVVGWGSNSYNQISIPAGLAGVTDLAIGNYHVAALKSDGTVVAWGYNYNGGETSVPAGLSNVYAISAYGSRALVLRDAGADAAPTITGAPQSASVTEGAAASFTVTATGAGPLRYQWRRNGAAINGATTATLTLDAVAPDAAGTYDVMVSNHAGATTSAPATLTIRALPRVAVASARRVIAGVGASAQLTVSASGSGTLSYQWRRNGAAIPGATSATLALPSLTRADAGWYVCAVTDANGSRLSAPQWILVVPSRTQVIGWGANSSRQAEAPAGLTDAVALAAGDAGSLALRADGSVVTWGSTSSLPSATATLAGVVGISIGSSSSLTLHDDGTVRVWGSYSTPTFPNGEPFVAVSSSGGSHTALRADGTAVAWSNYSTAVSSPSEAVGLAAIAAGDSFFVGLKSDGTVVQWGSPPQAAPTGLSGIRAIATGSSHVLALRQDGTVVAWGSNSTGACDVPAGLTGVVAISTSRSTSFAVKADGTVVAWGGNSYGERNAPVDMRGVHSLAHGTNANHALALRDLSADTAPVVAPLPANIVAAAGESVTLLATVSGAGPFSYQWAKNGIALSGATASTLALDPIADVHAGAYTVTVANHIGAAQSSAATLVVESGPSFTSRPAARIIGPTGATLTLSGAASGPFGPISYQWNKDNRPIPGATSSTLALANFANADAGAYTLVATDARGHRAFATTFVLPNYGATQLRSFNYSPPADLGAVVDFATTGYGNVAVRRDGSLVTWSGGVTTPPSGITDAVRVAHAGIIALALRADGSVIAWGSNSDVTTVPARAVNAVAIAASSTHALALRADGTVVAWGQNNFGQCNVPAGLTGVVAIAASYNVSGAVKADGSVVLWGGSSEIVTGLPVNLTGITRVVFGDYHALALKTDGTVVAWGQSSSGQTAVPTELTGVTDIAANYYASYAIDGSGNLRAWGNPVSLTDVTGPALDIAAGSYGFAVLRDSSRDTVPTITAQPADLNPGSNYSATFSVTASGAGPLSYQWRRDGSPIANATSSNLYLYSPFDTQVGRYDVVITNHVGSVTSAAARLSVGTTTVGPVIEPPAESRLFVAPGQTFACTLAVSGNGPLSYQWLRANRPLAGATSATLTLPNFTAADAGPYTLVVTDAANVTSRRTIFVLPRFAAARIVGWGRNDLGQISAPATITDAVALVAGERHSFALRGDGSIAGWGSNLQGQITVPNGLTSVVALAVGPMHSFALKSDGTVTGWGAAAGGVVSGASSYRNIIAISAGANMAAGVRDDGSVVGWGAYSSYSTVPTLTNATAVVAGSDHAVALRLDGTVAAWGDNTYGQTNVPVGLAGVTALAAGNRHTLALKADGTVAAWGQNQLGQATPPALSNVVAIRAAGDWSAAQNAAGQWTVWGDTPSATVSAANALGPLFSMATGAYHTLALVDTTALRLPLITEHPQGIVAVAGVTVGLRVVATGTGTLRYQWYRDAVALSDGANVVGSQTATLQLTGFSPAEVGNYSVVVTDAEGSVSSIRAPLSFAVSAQTIDFPALADRTYDPTAITLVANASSGLPVRFAVLSGPASVEGNQLMLTGGGTVVVRATQTGDAIYAPAGPVERSFVVARASASVVLSNLVRPYTGTAQTVAATTTPASLSLRIRYDGRIEAPIAAGIYSVSAVIDDPRYVGSAAGTFEIIGSAQTITFAPLGPRALSAGDVSLVATASSGLPVTFTLVSGPARLTGSQLALTGLGTVTVRASQPGDANYFAAPEVERSFAVVTGFTGWQAAHFIVEELATPSISGANADPDADGSVNLMEYALGTDPRAASSAAAPQVSATATEWTFTYTRPADRSDITYSVECSTNLSSWSSTGVTHTRIDVSGGVETWRANYPSNSAPCFFRLAVSRP